VNLKAPSRALEMSGVHVLFILPKLTLSLWEEILHNKAKIPTWQELNTFLTERLRALEAIEKQS